MKNYIAIILSLSIFLVGCGSSSELSKESRKAEKEAEKAAEFQEILELVKTGNYRFSVQSASPMGGKTIQITSTYTMDKFEGKYDAYLPYYGRAYSASYGGDGGVEFKGEAEEEKLVIKDDKMMAELSFEMKTENDLYSLVLNVGGSGFGTLIVSSQNRQTISYYGRLDKMSEKDEEEKAKIWEKE